MRGPNYSVGRLGTMRLDLPEEAGDGAREVVHLAFPVSHSVRMQCEPVPELGQLDTAPAQGSTRNVLKRPYREMSVQLNSCPSQGPGVNLTGSSVLVSTPPTARYVACFGQNVS